MGFIRELVYFIVVSLACKMGCGRECGGFRVNCRGVIATEMFSCVAEQDKVGTSLKTRRAIALAFC